LKKDQQILIIFGSKYFWHNWLLNKSSLVRRFYDHTVKLKLNKVLLI